MLSPNAQRFVELAAGADVDKQDSEAMTQMISDTLAAATFEVLSPTPARPKRPWVSIRTLELIDEWNKVRQRGLNHEQTELNKRIRPSAQNDRTEWLNKLMSDGSWDAIKAFKRLRKHELHSRK